MNKYLVPLFVSAFMMGCSDNSSSEATTEKTITKEAQSVEKPMPKPTPEPAKEEKKVESEAPKAEPKAEVKSAPKVEAKPKPIVKAEPKPEPKPTAVASSPKTVAPAPLKSGKDIYAKCAACHGADGGTKALGKSEVIKGWDAAKVAEALKGYKAGSRNIHGMGAIMKGQASTLSDSDIKIVSDYISKL